MENEDKVKAYFENRVHELLEEMQKERCFAVLAT